MTRVFDHYARYYDLLYRDKDYQGEAGYVHGLIQRYGPPGTRSILDLGCGTGAHAQYLAAFGLEVHGVDRSSQMLDWAEARRLALPPGERLTFSQGDIRQVRLGRTFDTVVALFHVMSYQTGNEDLEATLRTAREHLKPGGVFIFDCWYGPAVLTERPEVRVKRLEDTAIVVTRIAEPALRPNENLVEVNYQVFIKDKAGAAVEEVRETHLMRYLFQPEIEWLSKAAGFTLISCQEWRTGKEPGCDTWNVCHVIRAGN